MTLIDLMERRPGRGRPPQEEASDPTLSVFVTANAGSGKTYTLIQRVARLLLGKAAPETILCITYTKAAASEMQRRLYDTLGGWSVASDADLRKTLGALRGRPPESFERADLSDARSLFAAALETPGGLKIQTIHAFCEKVLRRFPLEAGVTPGFRVMDEPAAAAVAQAARRMVAHHVLAVPGEAADAYARLAVALDFRRFQAMFAEFEARRGELAAFLAREGGLEGAKAWVWRAVDIAPGSEPEAIAAETMAALDRAACRRCAEVLEPGTKTETARARVLRGLADEPDFEQAWDLLFTKDGDPRKNVHSSGQLKTREDMQTFLLGLQSRLETARARMRAAQVGADSVNALVLADAYLAAYAIEKDASGALDFADLVERTVRLLTEGDAAPWVLFKLDGGIDHILLDEAQDTAPEQWSIVDALTGEFFAGEGQRGRRPLPRGLFVVGDEKQSIYSFQGARPELLAQKHAEYAGRAGAAGFDLRRVDLKTSWRSARGVLAFVDALFSPERLAVAVQGEGAEPPTHLVSEPRQAHPGCVDVWDLEVDIKGGEREAWDLPLDLEPNDSANRKLARRMAAEISRILRDGDAVWCKDTHVERPAHAGDILILVRRRGALFEEILRELKHRQVPVAGADRLTLSNHIIFDDLLALARFALFPGDELTLAALLKSPFCGLADDGAADSLYALAHGRAQRLWRTLRDRADEQPLWREAADFLSLVIRTGREARPFEFFVRLTEHVGADGHSMRRRLLTRLGGEARDALDEFLNQVLAAEAQGAHDLESLADELSGLEIIVKREMEGARREVRVMTAHGAKGLEAPIVFLPETTLQQTQRPPPLMRVDRGAEGVGFLWCPRSAGDVPATAAARAERAAREDAEAYRLLYVALTRARDRLIICGRRAERTDPDKIRGWWGAVREALDHADIQGEVRDLQDAGGGRFRRYGQDPGPAAAARAATEPPVAPLPAWAREAARPDAFARYASPSDLGEAGFVAAPSPLAQQGGLGRFRRGDLIHRLLQLLPDLPPDQRAAGAAALLRRETDLTDAQRAEMTGAALAVLEDARFAEVFGPGSRAEAAVAGTASALPPGLAISGRIDRLVVLPDRVLVADFKTNRPSPDHIEDADPAYLRQMALYAAVLADIFPGRRIEAAIVWTDGPKLMAVPENLLAQALDDLRRGG